MNGGQDLGGMQGFGPVRVLPDERLDGPGRFHAAWEKRVLALTLAMGASGEWNIDMARAARESIPAPQYLAKSYYDIWLTALVQLLKQRGLVSDQELAGQTPSSASVLVKKVIRADEVGPSLARGTPYDRPLSEAAQRPAQFAVGQGVRTRQMNPASHTRLPRYARDKAGVIAQVRGVFVFPDQAALGNSEAAQWLYTVEFAATELWGADTTADTVCLDCWESYLEAADE